MPPLFRSLLVSGPTSIDLRFTEPGVLDQDSLVFDPPLQVPSVSYDGAAVRIAVVCQSARTE